MVDDVDADALGTPRFVALHSWRGVCALLVAVHNLNFGSWIPQVAFVLHSSLFVDFFFVLSGFVISHAYNERFARRSDVAVFMLRRIGRLWPLHVTMLVTLMALYFSKFAMGSLVHLNLDDSTTQGGHSLRTIATNLLLIQSFDIPSQLTWNAPSWSISTEFWTYFLFSMICLSTSGRRVSIFAMGGIALFAFGVLFCLSPTFLETNTDYAFFRCLYGFFVGCLVYKAWQTTPPRSGGGIEVLVLLLTMGFVYVVGNGIVSMSAPLVFGLAVFIFAQEQGWISGILSRRPFVQLGTWSYSIYMVHWLVRNVMVRGSDIVDKLIERQVVPSHMLFDHTWTTRVLLIGYLVVVVALAAVTYRCIEQPGRRFFNRRSAEFLMAGRELAR
jgi:peptidoglycan/LPS O-acetylase OafA/YrhL